MADKLLYIDACVGLSGDMLAGALLDLGWPLDDLQKHLDTMGLDGVKLAALQVDHQGVSACRLAVDDDADRAVNHRPSHVTEPDHHGHHGHGHSNGHSHNHEHHRHLSQILEMLARLPKEIALPASRVFQRLAEAEAKVHGKDPQEVHFHEVGAVDAIVDVTAFCAGLAWLGVERVICSPLPLGRGFFTCAHGRLPLPPPAVVNLLEGAPIITWPEEVETVTPTGAALVSSLSREFGPLPAMRLLRTGVGGGTRLSAHAPNIVRLMLGEARPLAQVEPDQVVEIVCNLDDMIPEDLPLVYERLFQAGALDVAVSPLYMKKGRPGLELMVMSPSAQAETLARLVLRETSSLGVRLRQVSRITLPRRMEKVDTPWGLVPVKLADSGQGEKAHVEAEDIMRICREHGLRPPEVRQKVLELLGKADKPE